MAPLKSLASVLLAVTFCSRVIAQASDLVVPPMLANNNCGKDISQCAGADTEIVTQYEGEPFYLTVNATATSTKIHTTTTTSIVAVIETSTISDLGICEMISTKTVKTRQTIPVTQTSTKVEHRVTSVVATSTATYIEYISAVSACIMEISAPSFVAAQPGLVSEESPLVDQMF